MDNKKPYSPSWKKQPLPGRALLETAEEGAGGLSPKAQAELPRFSRFASRWKGLDPKQIIPNRLVASRYMKVGGELAASLLNALGSRRPHEIILGILAFGAFLSVPVFESMFERPARGFIPTRADDAMNGRGPFADPSSPAERGIAGMASGGVVGEGGSRRVTPLEADDPMDLVLPVGSKSKKTASLEPLVEAPGELRASAAESRSEPAKEEKEEKEEKKVSSWREALAVASTQSDSSYATDAPVASGGSPAPVTGAKTVAYAKPIFRPMEKLSDAVNSGSNGGGVTVMAGAPAGGMGAGARELGNRSYSVPGGGSAASSAEGSGAVSRFMRGLGQAGGAVQRFFDGGGRYRESGGAGGGDNQPILGVGEGPDALKGGVGIPGQGVVTAGAVETVVKPTDRKNVSVIERQTNQFFADTLAKVALIKDIARDQELGRITSQQNVNGQIVQSSARSQLIGNLVGLAQNDQVGFATLEQAASGTVDAARRRELELRASRSAPLPGSRP